MSFYTPSAAHNNQENLSKELAGHGNLHSLDEIYAHYCPAPVQSHGTLNNSCEESNSLKFVVLFDNAHPRWKEDKIVFCHSNLHLLPRYSVDQSAITSATTNAAPPLAAVWTPIIAGGRGSMRDITLDSLLEKRVKAGEFPSAYVGPLPSGIAVFEHTGNDHRRFARSMSFVGYHKVNKVQYLPPRSTELMRMLEQKSNLGKSRKPCRRVADKWTERLSMEWAVVKLEEDEKAEGWVPPMIAALPGTVEAKKLSGSDMATSHSESKKSKKRTNRSTTFGVGAFLRELA